MEIESFDECAIKEVSKENINSRKCDCKINRKLVPLKINFFCQFVVIGSIFNFINPLLSTCGLSPSELGVTGMFANGAATLSRLVFGPIADGTRKKHRIIAGLTLATTVSVMLFFFMPQSREYLFEGYLLDADTFVAQVRWTAVSNSSGFENSFDMEPVPKVCWPDKLETCTPIGLSHSPRPPDSHYMLQKVSKDSQTAVFGPSPKTYVGKPEEDWMKLSHEENQFVRLGCTKMEGGSGHDCVAIHNQRASKSTGFVLLMAVVFRSLLWASQAPIGNLLDSVTYAALGENTHYYGWTRVFGSAGFIVSSLLVGILISRTSDPQGSTILTRIPKFPSFEDAKSYIPNYAPSLITAAIFGVISVIVSAVPTADSMQTKIPLQKAIMIAVRSADMIKCLVSVFFTGISFAFIGEYLFVILTKEYNVPHYFLGIMISTLVLSEVPAFLICGQLVRRLGETTCVSIAHILNMLRFMSFAYFVNYWNFLWAEVVCGFSFPLLINALLNQGARAGRISGTDAGDVVASMHGIIAAGVFGLMPCIGGPLWGLLLEHFTGRHLFYCAACYSLAVSLAIPVTAVVVNKLSPRFHKNY
ncbi:unnamed protein product [Calicophoron daubneyi]|uniref:Major facilitator superfamily associated domain-containing protein n=1 Tax=Calicophoron daubneyi TaxID=300641 RepID=A0AAV2TPP7_CALDB